MSALERYGELLRASISERRYTHSLEVMEEAVKLAKRFGESVEKAETAGLLHDITKEIPRAQQIAICRGAKVPPPEELFLMPKVLHGFTAAELMREKLSITDEQTLDAVRYHTTGRPGMKKLEKIIYLADCVGESRTFDGVSRIREALKLSLEEAMVTAFDVIMTNIIERRKLICSLSVEARNELIVAMKR